MTASAHAHKVVLITGGTGGIGAAIALALAKLGGTVVITGRDRPRGEAAARAIRDQSGNRAVELLLADLSSQAQVRALAADFMARYGRLDVLINNVGGLYGRRWETVDGIEGTLAVNHLCPYLLTNCLLPVLQASAPARVININSEGHRAAKSVDIDELNRLAWRRGFPVYSQSKLANLLFTYELARRLDPYAVTVNALHPGVVDTQLFRKFLQERFAAGRGWLGRAVIYAVRHVSYRLVKFDSVETAAECPVYLAYSEAVQGVTGKYFNLDGQLLASSPASLDEQLAQRVWTASAALCGLPRDWPSPPPSHLLKRAAVAAGTPEDGAGASQ